MSEERQEIKIIGIDKEAITMGSVKENFWVVPFKLSLKPNQDWERNFYEVQNKDKNVMKRKSVLAGDFIKTQVGEMDDLQKVLDMVRIEVTEANALCEGDYQKKMKIRHELEVLQNRQGDVTKKFREDADKLAF